MKSVLWKVVLTLSVLGGVLAWSSTPVESGAHVDDAARTQYPIVLAHGMMGFDHLGALPYWRGIPERLRAHGATVMVTQVSSFNSSEVRGQQLLRQVEEIVARTGARKVNLIGHSHGNQSIRYVAAMRPDLVASVTSVTGATGGSEVADWMTELDRTHPWAAAPIIATGNGVGHLINWSSHVDLPLDARAAMVSLTAHGAADFTRRFPAGVPLQPCAEGAHEVNGIRFYSWSGVGQFYRALNLSDYVMTLTHQAFRKERSDGLVGQCASHLGQVIRDDYPMNHFHAVNQFLGLVGKDVDPVQLFVEHAARLKSAGL
jgi:triacylglycerol lipase